MNTHRRRLPSLATLVGFVALLAVGPADAGPGPVGYATSSYTGNEQLWLLDVHTGTGTLVAETGLPPVTTLALTPDSNTLYGVNWSTDDLYTIDPSTASPTLVGPTGGNIPGGTQLTATGAGRLWLAIGGPFTASRLYQVNPSTGQVTLVGPMGQGFVTGIAGTCSGNLFGYAAGNLLAIDPATGAGSVIGATGLTDDTLSMAFDQNEHLWGVTSGGSIYGLDTNHGTATFVAHATGMGSVRTLALPQTCHH